MDIHKIINMVENNTSSMKHIGLLDGKAGAMILFFCYNSYSHFQQYEDLAFQKALNIKENRTSMYINELRIKLKKKNEVSLRTGIRDGYTGMGLTWLMDEGHITNDWMNLI